MSPEQCRGQPVDRRSDLFSLGTVLYELTTGTRPFLGNSEFMVMDQIVNGEPQPITIDGYPPDLAHIVMRMLARDPGARYQSAAGVVEDLERFAKAHSLLTGSHIVARYVQELFTHAEVFDGEWSPDSHVRFTPIRHETPLTVPDVPSSDTDD